LRGLGDGLTRDAVVNETLLPVAESRIAEQQVMELETSHSGSRPATNIPRVVVWLIATLVSVHLLRLYGPFDDDQIIYYFAFIPARFAADATLVSDGVERAAGYWSLITYSLIHADWLHLAINSAWMLAFGSVVARRLGPVRFLILSGIGAIAGALMYYAFHPSQFAVLVGASAAISAQVAAAARFMFARPGTMQWSYGDAIARTRPLSLVATFTNRNSLLFILIWLAINYAFGATGFGAPGGETLIAWEAHVGGFVAGLLTLGLVDRRRPRE
jgi:membrane associated rhomboid family serine protease